jgi:hypothetical protein
LSSISPEFPTETRTSSQGKELCDGYYAKAEKAMKPDYFRSIGNEITVGRFTGILSRGIGVWI